MAHKKASGGGLKQHHRPDGKRRGIKKYAGQIVKSGDILLKQKGSVFKAGANTLMGKDYTIFSVAEGIVKYGILAKNRGKKFVSVVTK